MFLDWSLGEVGWFDDWFQGFVMIEVGEFERDFLGLIWSGVWRFDSDKRWNVEWFGWNGWGSDILESFRYTWWSVERGIVWMVETWVAVAGLLALGVGQIEVGWWFLLILLPLLLFWCELMWVRLIEAGELDNLVGGVFWEWGNTFWKCWSIGVLRTEEASELVERLLISSDEDDWGWLNNGLICWLDWSWGGIDWWFEKLTSNELLGDRLIQSDSDVGFDSMAGFERWWKWWWCKWSIEVDWFEDDWGSWWSDDDKSVGGEEVDWEDEDRLGWFGDEFVWVELLDELDDKGE